MILPTQYGYNSAVQHVELDTTFSLGKVFYPILLVNFGMKNKWVDLRRLMRKMMRSRKRGVTKR